MKPVKARGLVDQLQGIYQVSIRRACDVLRFQKSSYFYKARRPSQAALRKRIQEIAATRVRYGNRRIHVLLRREGWPVNAKRVYRLTSRKACKSATNDPSARLLPSFEKTVGRLAPRTTYGQWTFRRTSCLTGARYVS